MSERRNDEETRRLEELWVRYLARETLSPDERATLAAAFERDEVLFRRMLQDLQIDGALRAAGEIERGQEKVVSAIKALVTAAGRTEEVVAAVRKRLLAKAAEHGGGRLTVRAGAPRTRAGRAVRVGAVLALFAGAAAALVILRPRLSPQAPSAPVAAGPRGGRLAPAPAAGRAAPIVTPAAPRVVGRLETVSGTVYRQGPDGTRRAAVSSEVAIGDWIWTAGAGARARVTGPAGSRVEIEGDAVAGIADDAAQPGSTRLFLAHGRATGVVPATTAGPFLLIASPHALVSGAGTVKIDVGPRVTRVEVKAGRARVSALGVQRGTEVESGQMALVSADDLQPPRAQVAPREAIVLVGPDDTREGPIPPAGLRGSEQRLKARLEKLGFSVTSADAHDVTTDRLRAAALLVLSPSISSQLLGSWFRELPVPMLVLESTGFESLGLTGSRWRFDIGPAGPIADIVITNPQHPLAAGLTGTVRVLTPGVNLRWALPGPGAVSIASYPAAPEQASLLFAYERGAATPGGPAASRRVALFYGNGRVIRALTEPGWRLFDAAALWAVSN